MGCGEDDDRPLDVFTLERAGQAFTEVQRADTKAAAVCGLAGGLLALSGAALAQEDGLSRIPYALLLTTTALLGVSLAAALLALRPAMPTAGLRAELTDADASVFGEGPHHVGAARRRWQERRLRALSLLADRKLRLVRLSVDLVLVALSMAGMALLSQYTLN
ncbi:hypothetical protein [Streptomyces sp. OM5714]|uniref:hypothetical protein n=1 Tax=Streptomyces sp. OM5714 TaxID=2602736 RepID=UPI0013DB7A5C|nr:hypothetical protein [Streptomyces sp. OM5714]KAF2775103.1 Valine dehydrogenase (ValDH) [Streptomyces sp. OM5714]